MSRLDKLLKEHDAVVLTGGSEKPRDLPIPGRELKGIHFAMDFLPQQNRRVSNEPLGNVEPILATGKKVVVIGGGDTGSDCIGTSIRQGAVSVTNFEIMPQPPEHENKMLTWPDWPLKLRTSSSHEEGVKRDFAVLTQKFTGENGQVKKLHCAQVDANSSRCRAPNSRSKPISCCSPWASCIRVHEGMLKSLNVALDQRGNVSADTMAYLTSVPKVFAAGDMRRGQSLVVWAIREGRQCGARRRQVPDGIDDAAALKRQTFSLEQIALAERPPPNRPIGRGGRGASSRCCGRTGLGSGRLLGFGGAFCVGLRGRRMLLGAVVFLSGVAAGSGRAVAAGADAIAPAGTAAAGGNAALPSLSGFNTKSSARPGGAATGSPLTSTRVAVASPCGELLPAPPSNSSDVVGHDRQRHHRTGHRARRRLAVGRRGHDRARRQSRSAPRGCSSDGGFRARHNAQACARRSL